MKRKITNKTKKKSGVPKFSSYEEEARFWDTHDTTDFEDEFKPVRVRFAKDLSADIIVTLDPDTLTKVRAAARLKKTDPPTIIRRWVMERLAK